eukprot:1156959-Pelagomonas_calceolata.AAC.3
MTTTTQSIFAHCACSHGDGRASSAVCRAAVPVHQLTQLGQLLSGPQRGEQGQAFGSPFADGSKSLIATSSYCGEPNGLAAAKVMCLAKETALLQGCSSIFCVTETRCLKANGSLLASAWLSRSQHPLLAATVPIYSSSPWQRCGVLASMRLSWPSLPF